MMTCNEIRKLLDDFVDGTASADAAAAIRAHTESCVACAEELKALETLRGVVAGLSREIEPDTDLWRNIEGVLDGLEDDIESGRVRVFGVIRRRFHAVAVIGRTKRANTQDAGWNWAGLGWRLGVAAAVVLLAVVGIQEWRGRDAAGGWTVTTMAGLPAIETRTVTETGTLREGEWLETDASSRARVDVARIGHVTVGPASAIRLKGSSEKEHRIELARGEVSAFIWAPPRLFFVETPSGVAEDLGCQYHLAVDDAGNGELEVTLGFVSFERGGREVIVPEGSRCDLRANVGPGTPHDVHATAELRAALAQVDFDTDAGDAIDAVLAVAAKDDAVTLWHLIPRAEGDDRARVVDRLASFVPLPENTTREGIIALDTRMLERWWEVIYPSWTHWN